MQVKLYFALGADLGRKPVVPRGPGPTPTVIDAVPVDDADVPQSVSHRSRAPRAHPQGRAPGDERRPSAIPGRALALPPGLPAGRGTRRAEIVPTASEFRRATSFEAAGAHFAPPGYDAGLRSFHPALLDVTV